MPNIDRHAPGSFTWFELATTDQAAAKKFYSSLFGWQAMEFPMGNDEVYTMFKLEGRDAGACFGMNAEMQSQGVPTHWALYIGSEDADATAAKAKELGGEVVVPPFDVFDFGRMAVLKDSTGAHVSVWQAKQHFGTGITGVPGTVCWAELSTPEQEKGADFYRGLFGWEIAAGEKEMAGYLHISNKGEMIGGIPPAQFRNPNAPPHWLLYFAVTDADAATEKAKELGATVYMGPMTMETVGRWSVVADPQGAVFSLFQPMARQ